MNAPNARSTSRGTPSNASDGALLRAVALGNPEAMKVLFEQTVSKVYEAAAVVLRNAADPEDVVQDTYLQVWSRAKDYSPERGTAASWLCVIARSRALDLLRAAELERRVVPPEPAALQLPAAEDAERVRNALADLTPVEREPLRLAYYEGLSQSEVAATLNVPMGTIKTRTRRALRMLALRLCDPQTKPDGEAP